MDAEQKAKIVSWLEEKWAEPNECPVCRHNDWQIPDDLIFWEPPHTPQAATWGGALVGDMPNPYPVFQVICNYCAYTLTFNARVAGIVGPKVVLGTAAVLGGGAFSASGSSVIDFASAEDTIADRRGSGLHDSAPATDEVSP